MRRRPRAPVAARVRRRDGTAAEGLLPTTRLSCAQVGQSHVTELGERSHEPPLERPDGRGCPVDAVTGDVAVAELPQGQRLVDEPSAHAGELHVTEPRPRLRARREAGTTPSDARLVAPPDPVAPRGLVDGASLLSGHVTPPNHSMHRTDCPTRWSIERSCAACCCERWDGGGEKGCSRRGARDKSAVLLVPNPSGRVDSCESEVVLLRTRACGSLPQRGSPD